MMDRRKLLRSLILLAPVAALAAACRNDYRYEEHEEPLKREGGGY